MRLTHQEHTDLWLQARAVIAHLPTYSPEIRNEWDIHRALDKVQLAEEALAAYKESLLLLLVLQQLGQET